MLTKFAKLVMSWSPQELLSVSSKERCMAKLKELPLFVFNDNAKTQAAVLLPLCVVNGEVCLLYTLRSSNLKSHSGQVSFPGGKQDGDETLVETALRETEEEIGVPKEDVEIWGVMTAVQGRNTDMLITPVVGVIKHFHMNKIKVNFEEVEEVFTVPVATLANSNNHGYLDYTPPLPLYIHKHKIWGITGLITHIFLNNFLSNYEFNFKSRKYTLDELMPPNPKL